MKISFPRKSVKAAWKVSATFTSLFLFLSSSTPALSYALEEATDNKEQESESVTSDSLQESSAIETTAIEVPEEENINDQELPVWKKNPDGTYETTSPLVLNFEYKIENLDNLKVVFTNLPETEGKLYVKQVYVPEEIGGDEVVSKAYNLVSNMEDGTFTYDLYLPRPSDTNATNLEVKYSEDGRVYSDVSGESFEGNYVVVRGLDHFTVFVITDDEASYTGTWVDYPTQGYLNTGVHYPTTIPAGATATWNFSTITPGSYDVSISWSTYSNRTTSAPYTLNYVGGSVNFNINQELLADQVTVGGVGQWSGWHLVGTYNLDTTSNLVLTGVDNSSGSEYVIADEVQLYFNVSVPTITTPPNNSYRTTAALTQIDWTDSSGTNLPFTYQYQAFSDANYTINRWGPSTWLANSYIPTPGTPQGVYYVRVRAQDSSGNTTEWSNGAGNPYRITVDNTLPVITFADNVAVGPVQSDTIVIIVAEANPNTSSFEYGFSTDNICNASDTYGNSFTSSVPFTISNESHNGNYICARASDLAGNISYQVSANPLNIESTPPSVGAVTVINDFNPYVRGNGAGFDIRMPATDLNGVTCQYTLDGSTWLAATYNGAGNRCEALDVTAPDGQVLTINMMATDGVGNFSVGTGLGRTADSVVPIVSGFAISPNNAGFTSSSPVLTATFTDNLSPILSCQYRYRVTGTGTAGWTIWTLANWAPDADPRTGVCTGNISGLTEGTSYDFQLRGRDSVNHYRTAAFITRVVDSIPPASTVYIQGDLDEVPNIVGTAGWHGYGWYESYDNVNLRISSGDTTNDIVNYQILNGDVACPAQGDGGYSSVGHDTNVNSDVNGTDGEYTLCFYAQDIAGNLEATVHKQVLRIDNTNPTYTIDYSSIAGNVNGGIYYINSDTISVDVNVGDNLSGYTRARYDLYTADASWNCTHNHANQDNLLPPSTSTTRTFTESGLADGWYCLRIWVYDDVQNKAWTDTNGQGWVLFVLDNQAPIFTVNTTIPSGNQHGIISGTVEASDIGRGDSFIDGITATYGTFSDASAAVLVSVDWTWDTTEVPDGFYDVTFCASDFAGNVGTGSSTTLPTVDGNECYTVTIEVDNHGSIQGRKFHDANWNNVKDPGETFLAGWNIYLFDAGWNLLDSMATDENDGNGDGLVFGQYRFEGLDAGRYYVCEEFRPSWYQVRPTSRVPFQGFVEGADIAERCFRINLAVGQERTGVQFWNYYDDEAPVIDDLDDLVIEEGQIIDDTYLSFLIGKHVSDNAGLANAYYTFTFNGVHGETYTTSGSFDISSLGTGYTITASDITGISFPLDTSVIPEGDYILSYQVDDFAGNRSDCDEEMEGDQPCSFQLTITNDIPSPTLTKTTPDPIYEGDSVSFTGTFEDNSYLNFGGFVLPEIGELTNINALPDDADWTYAVDYGDGNTYGPITVSTPGIVTIPNHVYNQAGNYMVTLAVTEGNLNIVHDIFEMLGFVTDHIDGENETGTATLQIVVNNVAPTVTISADPGTTVANGTTVTLTANPTGGNAPITYSWSGSCSGSSQTATVPSTPGTYNCTVTVTDADLDTATSSITVVVNPPGAVAGAITRRIIAPAGAGEVSGEATTSEEEQKEEEKEEGEVLGEGQCENSSKVSGYIYYDNNGNGQKDSEEEGVDNILISIYTEVDGEEKFVTTARTNSDGYWEAELCPGSYKVKVDKEELPEKVELEGDESQKISVEEFKDVENVNFGIKKVGSKFNWLLCLIPLLLFLALLVILYLASKRKEEKRYAV